MQPEKQLVRERLKLQIGPLMLHRREQWDLNCWPIVAAHWKTPGRSRRIFALWKWGIATPKKVYKLPNAAWFKSKLRSVLRTSEITGVGMLWGKEGTTANDVYISVFLLWEPRDWWRGAYFNRRVAWEPVLRSRYTVGTARMHVLEAFVCIIPCFPLRLRVERLPEYHTRL